MFDEGAHGGDAAHVVQARLDDVLRMGQYQGLDAAPLGFLEHQPGLADVQMTARERHAGLGDDVEDFLGVVAHRLVRVEDGHRRRGPQSSAVEAG